MSKITPGKWQSQDLNLRSATFLAIAVQVSTMRYRRYLQRGRPWLWSQRHPHGLRIRGKGPAGGTMSPFQVITWECRLALLSRPSVSNMYPKAPLGRCSGGMGRWQGGRWTATDLWAQHLFISPFAGDTLFFSSGGSLSLCSM